MNIPKKNIARWQKNSPAAFRAWLADIKPRILHRDGKYHVFQATPHQDEQIDNILASDKHGNFQNTLSLLVAPRRHSKSTINSIVSLWFFTSRQNFTIQLLGSTESHCKRTMYKALERIIRNTPLLNQMISENDMQQYSINFPSLQNTIQMSAHNAAASFGERINLLWVSDLHSAIDLEPFEALQASLLDSEDALCLIDSNVDTTDGHLHVLQKEAANDPTMFCNYTSYKDFEDYKENAPPWINRARAERLQRTTLEVTFKRDILGQRSDSKNALFPSAVIELCKSNYKFPVADISEITKGRAYKVGGGLDRSKNLFQSKTSDATVWTTILKVASLIHGEPEYYILNQQKINPNTSRSIKKIIIKDHERYHLDNVGVEAFEVADLAPWIADQGIPHELVSAHDTNQNASFPEFYRIAKEGRFHFPESCKDLASEMTTFTYTQRNGGKFSFGHSSAKHHDDFVYSTNWAIFSLRASVLNIYTLGSFQCLNRTAKRRLCCLMGGSLQLLCARDCSAFLEVQGMFKEYKQYQLDSELTLPEFYREKVQRRGARISQAV